MEEILQQIPVPPVAQRLSAAAGVIAMAGGSATVWAVDPSQTHLFPICPLFAMTGFACPGCGLTRAFHSLFHGDIVTALHFNALIPIWAVIFGFLFVSLILTATRGRGLPWRFIKPSMMLGMLFLMLTFGVLRNLPHYPFTLLFP